MSVSGLLFVVQDLRKTRDFYKKLGFIFKEETSDFAKAYMNWFSLEFVPADKVEPTLFQKVADTENVKNKGAGLFVQISVDNVDDYHKDLIEKGFKPSSEPKDWTWGRREFVLRDPDGYKLVFFSKTKPSKTYREKVSS